MFQQEGDCTAHLVIKRRSRPQVGNRVCVKPAPTDPRAGAHVDLQHTNEVADAPKRNQPTTEQPLTPIWPRQLCACDVDLLSVEELGSPQAFAVDPSDARAFDDKTFACRLLLKSPMRAPCLGAGTGVGDAGRDARHEPAAAADARGPIGLRTHGHVPLATGGGTPSEFSASRNRDV